MPQYLCKSVLKSTSATPHQYQHGKPPYRCIYAMHFIFKRVGGSFIYKYMYIILRPMTIRASSQLKISLISLLLLVTSFFRLPHSALQLEDLLHLWEPPFPLTKFLTSLRRTMVSYSAASRNVCAYKRTHPSSSTWALVPPFLII